MRVNSRNAGKSPVAPNPKVRVPKVMGVGEQEFLTICKENLRNQVCILEVFSLVLWPGQHSRFAGVECHYLDLKLQEV